MKAMNGLPVQTSFVARRSLPPSYVITEAGVIPWTRLRCWRRLAFAWGLLGYPDEAMEVQAALLENLHPEEVAIEASWRPKWIATGPVVP